MMLAEKKKSTDKYIKYISQWHRLTISWEYKNRQDI